MDFSKEVPTLPSDSDDSDEDYNPLGPESDPPSEVESDSIDEVPDSDEEGQSSKKRKKVQKGTKKKAKKKERKFTKTTKKDTSEEEDEETENSKQPVLTEEEEKKRADSLWADFMKDTKPGAESKKSNDKSHEKGDNGTVEKDGDNKTEVPKKEKENKVTVTEVYEFAGEEVKVMKEVEASSKQPQDLLRGIGSSSSSTGRGGRGRAPGGLSSVLGQLGKKGKLGTLEKSKLDWDKFKKTEGIEDELKTFNRGKDGYLEKQDFLQRTDLRQFEIEKGLRATRRSNR